MVLPIAPGRYLVNVLFVVLFLSASTFSHTSELLMHSTTSLKFYHVVQSAITLISQKRTFLIIVLPKFFVTWTPTELVCIILFVRTITEKCWLLREQFCISVVRVHSLQGLRVCTNNIPSIL